MMPTPETDEERVSKPPPSVVTKRKGVNGMNIKVIPNLTHADLTGEELGFDVETTITNTMDDLATLQLYQESNDTCYIVPIRTKTTTESEKDKEKNREVLSQLKVIGHYLQFDQTSVLHHYNEMPTVVGDTYLLACMLQWEHKGLKTIARVFCPDSECKEIEDVVDLNLLDWDTANQDHLEYMAGDAYKALKTHRALERRGTVSKLGQSYQIDLKALPAFVRSRVNGLHVDMNHYQKLMEDTKKAFEEKETAFHEAAGRPAKVGSPKDIQRLLFLDLGLPETPVRTATGAPSTNDEALNYLIGQHPCVEALRECKHLQSVISGSRKLPEFLREDGRLHPEFRQIGEDGTSRVYTSKPSANQYPIELREAIIPPPGKKFIYFDWSAAELILAAYWAGCVDILEQYQKGDLHRYVASRILGRNDITAEEREKIKVVVFATLFGSEGDAASRSLMIPLEEAKSYVYKFYQEFKEMDELKTKLEERAKRTLYTRTIYGRPRHLPKIKGDYHARAHALRQAVNTAIQGSVADLLKKATARTIAYRHLGIEFVIGVFDSLLLSAPMDMKEEEYVPIIEKLSTFGDLKLKFKYAEGPNWKHVQDHT